ncbi:MAG: hypothetical protein Q9181_007632 [Wetmoreana brouardii]
MANNNLTAGAQELIQDHEEPYYVNGDVAAATGPFGLPIAVIKQLIHKPYDALWVLKYNVDSETLNKDRSQHNFEAMYNNGALRLGDELYQVGTYTLEGNTFQLEKVAKIIGESRDNGTQGYKRPSLIVTSGGIYGVDIPACHGIRDIQQAFNQVMPKEENPHQIWSTFRKLHVRRGTAELGTLYDVRQAWHTWRNEMDAWASSQGIKYRFRRSSKVPGGSPFGYDEAGNFRGMVDVRSSNSNSVRLREISATVTDSTALNAYHLHISQLQIEYLLHQPYDNLWMQQNSIDPVVLSSFQANHSLECLVLYDVLLVGDYLMVYDKSEKTGDIPKRYAQLTATVRQEKKWPAFGVVYDSNGGSHCRDIVDCKGPRDIFQAWAVLQPRNELKFERSWAAIHVQRGESNLGTLDYVRQQFGYYQMLMDGYLGGKGGASKVLAMKKMAKA